MFKKQRLILYVTATEIVLNLLVKSKISCNAWLKLNVLTQQLEDEMESAGQGEYFG